MRELRMNEIDAVSGGVLIDSIGPLTGIAAGLRFATVAGVLSASYYTGYAIGTAIYNSYTSIRY